MAKLLTDTALATLKAFWDGHDGGLIPFYFYDPFAANPVGSNYDPTGSSVTGRYTVVFRGNWSETTGMLRTQTGQIQLVEVA